MRTNGVVPADDEEAARRGGGRQRADGSCGPRSPFLSVPRLVEGQVELEDVDARLAEDPEARGVVWASIAASPGRRSGSGPWRPGAPAAWALATEMSGSSPEPDAVTASTGTGVVRGQAVGLPVGGHPLGDRFGSHTGEPSGFFSLTGLPWSSVTGLPVVVGLRDRSALPRQLVGGRAEVRPAREAAGRSRLDRPPRAGARSTGGGAVVVGEVLADERRPDGLAVDRDDRAVGLCLERRPGRRPYTTSG